MDMPDDTPKKIHKMQSDEQKQYIDAQDDNFSSFDSNERNQNQSTSSIDEHGFKNMHVYKQKQMSFPQVPPNLGKLYQIYIQNVNRKIQMKKSIQQLIAKQIKALRIAYDKQTFSIQQYIDLDQQSKQYKISRQNYEKRQVELQKLARKYRELKIMHVQSMMVIDPIMTNTLGKFIKKNKQIVQIQVINDLVFVLCNQKFKSRKISKFKSKKCNKKLNNNSEQSGEAGEDQIGVLEKATRSRNASQTASQDQQEHKINHRFVFRKFKFFKTANGVSFQPLQHFQQIPIYKDYKGFIIQQNSGQYIVYEDKKAYIFELIQRQFKQKTQLNFDSPIILCEIVKNNLCFGTKDGIVKVYEIKQNGQLVLAKIAVCTYGNYQQVTNFALTNNPDIIIFVKNYTYLCQMNLSSYSSYLLSQLPEPIVSINSRLIKTKNCIYSDYYIGAGSHGKAVLQHNEKLSKLAKNRNLIKLHNYQNKQYAIFYEQFGVFGVECLNQEK